MSDGAHYGLTAEQALGAVLGGGVPDGGMTPEQMAAYLDAAPDTPGTYDDVSRWAARGIRRYLLDHPEAFKIGDACDVFDQVYPCGPGGTLSEVWPQLEDISGFMMGWAVNAARYSCRHNAVNNPAIVDITVTEST